jgi:hypothetical protein
MSLMTARLFPITILNGAINSNVLKAREAYEDALFIVLYAPAVLDAFTFTIEVTADPEVAAPVFVTLQQGTTPADAAPPLAVKARAYGEIPGAMGFRIHSSAAVAADRIWLCSVSFRSMN